MDSEHRHELKSNELAEGLSNLPAFLKDNANTIIGVLLICVGLISWPLFSRISNQKKLTRQIETTRSIQLLDQDVYNIINTQQSKDAKQASSDDALSTLRLDAESLLDRASKVDNPNLKALAQIKAAQAYRAELHLRKDVDPKTIEDQISKAQAAYEEAAKTAKAPEIKAMAQFGLALCSEERGQFAQAGQLYKDILADESFKPTTVYKLAQQRLDSLDDNSETFSFTEAPKPVVPTKTPANTTVTDVKDLPADGTAPAATDTSADTAKEPVQTGGPTE